MTTTRRERWTTRVGLALGVLAAAATLAAGAGTASAAPASGGKVTATCWKDIVNDWLQHQPNVVGHYPIACYRQAIQHLNNYPDIRQYSNAPDDIHRAMLLAISQDKGGGGSGQSSGGGGGGGGGGSSSGGGGSSSTGGGTSTTPQNDKSFITRLFDAVGPANAESIPLPLLVLAGLAVLLLLAALGTWLAKRIQARRMTPAPAPAPAPHKRP
jgi:hypothetical protein